ncbi:MAG: hypothetical protein HUU54_00415 [Ignavibacteriaceae bacterium]|nr:hypothetical protein [Ignavibacteriaceae bacterium]
MNKTLLFLTIFALLGTSNFAQSFADSIIVNPVIKKNTYLINYDKQFYTHSLSTTLTAGINKNDFTGGINLNINSVVSGTGTKSLRDQNQMAFITGYNPSRLVNISLITSHENYKDTRETGLNFLSNTEFLALGKFSNRPELSASLFYGMVQNKQLGDLERGNKYGIWGKIDNYDELDLLVNSSLIYEKENFDQRKKQSSAFRLRLDKDFGDEIKIGFFSAYSSKSRDFYIKADSALVKEYEISKNILTREEDELSLAGNFQIGNLQRDLSFSVNGGLLSKGVARLSRYKSFLLPGENVFDSRLDEISIILNSSLDYISDEAVIRVNAGYNTRDERQSAIPLPGINQIFFERRSELEAKKNNLAQRALLSVFSEVKLSERERITIQLFQSKLKYDTPSKDNFDDRDELLTIAKMRYSRNLTQGLLVFLSGEYTYSRLVYLFAERSSNNTIGRLYKINTGNEINNKYLTSKNLFEVSANYSVYDYEAVITGYKSFSFRQMYFSDSTTFNIGRNVKLGFTGFYRLSEQSELKWTEFTIKPVRVLEELLLFPKIMTQIGRINFAAGIRRFTIFTFNYSKSVKTLQNQFVSIAPAAEIDYLTPDGLLITFRGWHEFNSTSSENRFELTNFYSEIKYFF